MGRTALYAAVSYNKQEVVNLLLSAGANPNIPTDNGSFPLTEAIGNQNTGIVRALLSNNAQANVVDRSLATSPLIFATILNEQVVFDLIAHGGELNFIDLSGRTALDYAIKNQ